MNGLVNIIIGKPDSQRRYNFATKGSKITEIIEKITLTGGLKVLIVEGSRGIFMVL